MKRFLILTLLLLSILMLADCTSAQSSDKLFKTDKSVDIEELKNKYPEYFELNLFKGIEVYVWQIAENTYRCGMMSGTNRNKNDEEIWDLQEKALSIEETKEILNEIGVEKDYIIIIPIAQPYSSYLYEINDTYKEKVEKLFM